MRRGEYEILFFTLDRDLVSVFFGVMRTVGLSAASLFLQGGGGEGERVGGWLFWGCQAGNRMIHWCAPIPPVPSGKIAIILIGLPACCFATTEAAAEVPDPFGLTMGSGVRPGMKPYVGRFDFRSGIREREARRTEERGALLNIIATNFSDEAKVVVVAEGFIGRASVGGGGSFFFNRGSPHSFHLP